MNKTRKRNWRPQFSLRTLCLFCLLVGGPVAWLSHSYHEYLAEQRFIDTFATRTPPGSVVTVTTNGETTSIVGRSLM